MTFSELIDAVRHDPHAVNIPAEWSQGRACFGGLMAALTFDAMRAEVPEGRPGRSVAF
ncbi:thioesterase family protein, partial [Pseudomonas syringae pv. tagetis]